MRFQELLEKVKNGLNLTSSESKSAVFAMMDGSWDASQTGELLMELHKKGESPEEIVGFAQAMREKAVHASVDGRRVLDTCGTGGDQKNSFNISTIAAFVLAGCGIPIVKHGNRAASSACGSADLLQEMGISYRMRPDDVSFALEKTSFAFLFAPDYHPATRSVVAVRKQLGMPTIFNVLGPLTNPAFPQAQVIGVYEKEKLPFMEDAIRRLDPEKRAILLHSLEGYDEATPTSDFFMHTTFSKPIVETASRFGFPACSNEEIRGGQPGENAAIALAVLNGESGARRNTVLLNALLGYVAYHPDATYVEAGAAVKESVDSGAALRVVKKLRERFPA